MPVTTHRYRVTLHRLHQFFSKVQMTSTCWYWTGGTTSHGYGVFDGTSAHRFSYTWMVRPIPEGLLLDHLCRTPLCVNPAHLEAVTHQVNMTRAHNVRLHPLSDFAEHLGISKHVLRRILNGQVRFPRTTAMLSIEAATGITIRQMAEGQLPALLSKHFAEFKDTQAQQTTGYFDIPNGSAQVIDKDSEVRHDI